MICGYRILPVTACNVWQATYTLNIAVELRVANTKLGNLSFKTDGRTRKNTTKHRSVNPNDLLYP